MIFIERYLLNYGSFQDAINKENTFMFHSLLSPYLNSGLLDPLECIEKAEKKSKIWGIKVKDGIALRGNNISISNKNIGVISSST